MKIECKSNTLCSWRKGKNQETLICFLECFWVFFLVFGREKKKCREQLGRKKILEKCVFSLSGVCLGLFIASGEKKSKGKVRQLLGQDILVRIALKNKLRGKCLVSICRFSIFAYIKQLCSTPGSIHSNYTASVIKPQGKATSLLAH